MVKKRFKLYKSGKQWLSMAIVAIASATLGMTMATNGQADTSIQNNTVSTSQVVTDENNQQVTSNSGTADNNADTQSGLVQRDGNTYFSTGNNNYVSDEWENVNNSWYYFGDNGAATKGWYKSNAGYWYYFDQNTAQAETGWQQINNNWYLFDNSSSAATTGWYKSNAGFWYYFDNNNAWADKGWQKINNNWYYFDENNSNALTGWQYINNNWYHFDETNAWATTGWYKSNAGFWYYFDNNNAWALTGWQYINNAWYYFDPDNANMFTGTHTINGTTYNFNADGSWADDHSAAVNKAMSVRGTSYVWGGNNPYTGFDCSGLVQWAYGLGGNYRTTYQQQTLGAHHYDVANAPKGSLLFFGSDSAPYHVAISLGNGAYVHAPQPGDVVKVGYTRYYSASYYVVL